MAPIALKVASIQSFSPFTELESAEDLAVTWRICTRVKEFMENGTRLENLSWRLWHLHQLKAADRKVKATEWKTLSKEAVEELDEGSRWIENAGSISSRNVSPHQAHRMLEPPSEIPYPTVRIPSQTIIPAKRVSSNLGVDYLGYTPLGQPAIDLNDIFCAFAQDPGFILEDLIYGLSNEIKDPQWNNQNQLDPKDLKLESYVPDDPFPMDTLEPESIMFPCTSRERTNAVLSVAKALSKGPLEDYADIVKKERLGYDEIGSINIPNTNSRPKSFRTEPNPFYTSSKPSEIVWQSNKTPCP